MKQFILSAVVLTTFIAYSLYYHISLPQLNPTISINQPKKIPQTKTASSLIPVLQSNESSPLPSPSSTLQPETSPSDTPIPTDTPQPTPTPTPTLPPSSQYKDGTYQGDPADAFYGTIQVAVTISGGKITDVQFLQYPNDRSTSIAINSQAMPYLRQEAIQNQNAQVDVVSGATDSSMAFIQSIQSALSKAKNS